MSESCSKRGLHVVVVALHKDLVGHKQLLLPSLLGKYKILR